MERRKGCREPSGDDRAFYGADKQGARDAECKFCGREWVRYEYHAQNETEERARDRCAPTPGSYASVDIMNRGGIVSGNVAMRYGDRIQFRFIEKERDQFHGMSVC